MSRLIFEKILQNADNTRLPEPFIERINLVSGIDNGVLSDTVDGVEVRIVFYYRGIGKNNLNPSNVLNKMSNTRIIAACIFGSEENDKIIKGSTNIFDYLVTHDSSLSNWVLTGHQAYNPGRHAPNPDARVIPLALNEESIYEVGNLTIEYIANLINFTSVSFSDLVDEGESQVQYSNDMQTKYYKFSTSITVPMTFPRDLNITTYEQLMELLSEEYKNMNVYAFTTPIDWEDLSDDERKTLREKKPLLNKMTLSKTYQSVFLNGEIVPNEEVNFVDNSNNIYDGPVMLDINNSYKGTTQEAINEIIAKTETMDSGSAGSEVRKQSDNLKYIVNTFKNDPRLLIELNNYRKLYPNKNDGTPSAAFYNSFKNMYSNSLAKLQKNQNSLVKSFSLNPIVFDNREASIVNLYDQPEVVQATADGNTEDDKRFPKEYITRYAYSSTKAAGEPSETFTWEDEDIICDNGFIFFDYERALRNDTIISSLFNVDKLQSYFGKKLINGTLALLNTTLTKKYVNNAGSATELRTARTIETTYRHGVETTFGPIASSLSDGETAYVGINYDRVDVGMSGKLDRSYCVLRNIVPAGSERYDLGTKVKSAQVDSFQEDYRFMCFYFQDYYDVSVAADTVTSVDGIDYTEQSYTLNVVFKDQSVQLLNTLKENYEKYMSTEDYSLKTYYDYAESTGNNNNYTGYFNNFFVNGVMELFSDNPNSAPWITVPIIYNIHRDIILDTFSGDAEALLRNAANTTAKIAPRTGTLEQLDNYKNLVDSFYEEFYGTSGVVSELISEYDSEFDTDSARELDYYHEIPTLRNIIFAGETYEEYIDDVENSPAYPIEISSWSDSMTPGGASVFDTSTLYTRAELRSELDAVQYIGNLLSFIDYLDTNPSGLSTTAVDGRLLLQKLLVPPTSGTFARSTYYRDIIEEVSLSGYYLYWWTFLTTEYPVYATLYPTPADLSVTDFGLNQRLEYMARRIFAAQNYAGSEFGTSSQISDFYEFLNVGDSYKVPTSSADTADTGDPAF